MTSIGGLWNWILTLDWNLVVGALSLLVSTVVTIVVFRLGSRVDFRQRMARREALRETSQQILADAPSKEDLPEVLLINAARYERDYDGGNKFTRHGLVQCRAEFLAVRHNGIELVDDVVNTWLTPDGRPTLSHTPRKGPNVLRVGFVSFDHIEHIDPVGDEYRYAPIFFVQFRGRGQIPYSHHTYVSGEGRALRPGGRKYYPPLDELGQHRPSWLQGHLNFIRSVWDAWKVKRSERRRPSL